MNENLQREIEATLSKQYNPAYYLHQTPTIFHVSEAAKCTSAVLNDRLKQKYQEQLGNVEGLFTPDKSFFTLGRAYENYLAYKICKGYKNGYSIKRHIPVFIPLDFGCGFKGAPDLMYQEGNLNIPIEIKTTGVNDIEYYAKGAKVLIQGCAYGYGAMSDYWVLIAASKSSPQQTYLKKKTTTPIPIMDKEYTIKEFLTLKWFDLTENSNSPMFSPMFNWECKYCDYQKDCPYKI
jgi:hypothetical protein